MPAYSHLIFCDIMKILALHLQSFLEFAQVRGLDQKGLTGHMHSYEPNQITPFDTVGVDDFYAVLAAIHKEFQDDQLGWRIGNFLNLNALGLIYQISLQAKTIEEAIYYLKDFMSATFPLISLKTKLEEAKGSLEMVISTDKILLNRMILECVLVIIARELQMMCTDGVSIKVFSPYFTPAYPPNFHYGDTFKVEFSELSLKASLRRFEQAKLNLLIPEYLKLIQELKQEQSFQNRVKIAMLNRAKPELPALAEIAESFHLTPRSFQRRLASEKLTFRKICDELKKQISVLLLRHISYSISDVGYLLGYSEPAAFVHSFKKWYGYPPSTIRETGAQSI